ncbi:Polyadenylate-binding protein/Hyperplastic disc protein [Corchorus olitorius]|uniref:Polyadenylate-binding protein/Hyperplastic disc protein n=1 Tax=Corchorus olitorius TaxID=93759 RepID=A0A1R3KYP8_9ROSI|nr:Polyadenylate-binding protein/Hyperplastic disc protein [Corchorus olitorius]
MLREQLAQQQSSQSLQPQIQNQQQLAQDQPQLSQQQQSAPNSITPDLIMVLAAATPEQRRTILGENLFPLVYELEHENAAKVTRMLLEMDPIEVLHLLDSPPQALKYKVAEAMARGDPRVRKKTNVDGHESKLKYLQEQGRG